MAVAAGIVAASIARTRISASTARSRASPARSSSCASPVSAHPPEAAQRSVEPAAVRVLHPRSDAAGRGGCGRSGAHRARPRGQSVVGIASWRPLERRRRSSNVRSSGSAAASARLRLPARASRLPPALAAAAAGWGCRHRAVRRMACSTPPWRCSSPTSAVRRGPRRRGAARPAATKPPGSRSRRCRRRTWSGSNELSPPFRVAIWKRPLSSSIRASRSTIGSSQKPIRLNEDRML